jgi:hypothetical protein
VTAIGDRAFSYCSGLTQLEIPSSVATIGEYAFCNCSSLRQLEIPSTVTTIGACAFWGCSGLRKLQIPSSFANIGDRDVFNGVTNLERLILLGCPLSWAVVANLRACLTQATKVIGAALVGEKFGSVTIVAA